MTTAAAPGRRELGAYGERLAERHLRALGMEIVARNWRCEHGEIDLVARDGSCLVVCEVKTRRGTGFGEPVEQVTWAKATRLRRLAAAYLRAHPGRCDEVRVDVIGILRPSAGPARLRHVRAVGWT